MSIVLIGGLDKMKRAYQSRASKYGHKIKVMTQITPKFEKNIGKPDVIILFTATSSHPMAAAAVKEAKRKNVPLFRAHCSSIHSLESVLRCLHTI